VDSIALHGIVLEIIGSSDLGEERCDHFYHVADGHATNFILHLLQRRIVEDASAAAAGLATHKVGFSEALDMRKVADMYDSLSRFRSCRRRKTRGIVWYLKVIAGWRGLLLVLL
jgi:hypothetical protein